MPNTKDADVMRLHLDAETTEPATVYVAWIGSHLLNIYQTPHAAEDALAAIRASHCPAEWREWGNGWYHQEVGFLFVEPKPLIAALPVIHADSPQEV